jgi:hypothetical protein
MTIAERFSTLSLDLQELVISNDKGYWMNSKSFCTWEGIVVYFREGPDYNWTPLGEAHNRLEFAELIAKYRGE